MRSVTLGTLALLAVSSAAFAQEQPNSQTLDEQKQRVENGQPAVPLAPAAPAPVEAAPPAPPPVEPAAAVAPAGPMDSAPAALPPTSAAPAEPATTALDNQIETPKKEEVKAEEPKKEEAKKEEEKPVAKKPAAKKAKAKAKPKAPARKNFKETPEAKTPAQSAPAADVFTQPIPAAQGNPATAAVARSGEVIESKGGDAIPSLPLTVYEAGGIKYVTGGVGSEEEAQLKSVAHDFNLQLLLTAAQGEYLSDAFVRVLGAGGAELMRVDQAGPYFYARLAPGSYTIEVTARQGGIRTLPVKIDASGTVRDQMRFTE